MLKGWNHIILNDVVIDWKGGETTGRQYRHFFFCLCSKRLKLHFFSIFFHYSTKPNLSCRYWREAGLCNDISNRVCGQENTRLWRHTSHNKRGYQGRSITDKTSTKLISELENGHIPLVRKRQRIYFLHFWVTIAVWTGAEPWWITFQSPSAYSSYENSFSSSCLTKTSPKRREKRHDSI